PRGRLKRYWPGRRWLLPISGSAPNRRSTTRCHTSKQLPKKPGPRSARRKEEDMLEVRNLSVWYDQTRVVHDVSFSVAEGTCRALIGPNGAGKSSLLNAIAGRLRPVQGQILFRGQDIATERSDKIANLGLALSPQDRQVFTKLTVRENLLMGAYRIRSDKARVASRLEYVLDVFPKLQVL